MFVVWHPSFKDGQEYADLIFSEFKRDVKAPLARGMNIPVYFRYLTPLLEIPFDQYEFTVTVALIDSAFVIDNDYKQYLVSISQYQGKSLLIVRTNLLVSNLDFELHVLSRIRSFDSKCDIVLVKK